MRVALEHFDGAEIDIQLTKDKIPIVLHDDTLRRTAVKWPENAKIAAKILDTQIDDLSWDSIKDVVVGERGEKIPTLQEALNVLKIFPTKRLLIEIKSYDSASNQAKKDMVEALNQLFTTLDPKVRVQTIFISFDANVLLEAADKIALKSIPRYWLLTEDEVKIAASKSKIDSLLTRGQTFDGFDIESGSYLNQPVRDGKTFPALIKERGQKLITWISRRKGTDGVSWKNLSERVGVDIFTSDLPDDIWRENVVKKH
jgi:glycerophosphoryl diester phosphodiesterase